MIGIKNHYNIAVKIWQMEFPWKSDKLKKFGENWKAIGYVGQSIKIDIFTIFTSDYLVTLVSDHSCIFGHFYPAQA